MTCSKCRRAMVERKRVYHGRRKWVCPRCGKVRFQEIKKGPGQRQSAPRKRPRAGRRPA